MNIAFLKTDNHKRPSAPEQAANGQPIVALTDGELSQLADKGETLLINAGVQIYQRGGKLVRPVLEEVGAAHGRKTRIVQLVAIDATYLRDLLCRHAVWIKYNSRDREWRQANPPREIAEIILARVGDWKIRSIAGVISAPTMRPDGSLITEPGYDDKTGLLLVDPPTMPVVPEEPSKSDALKALALLEGLLVSYPFVGDVDRAVALSALITPIVRAAFDVAPLHVARAPVPGSGKSHLFDTAAAIAIGQRMPVISKGDSEAELEKRLGATCMTGQPLINIDNVNGELGGEALCQLVERPIVDIRILGRSEKVRIETRGTTLYANGNNLTLVGDVCRRAITSTLDPGLERPELRQFPFDPVKRVLEDRGAYIAAALTICRAYKVASSPTRAPSLASFEGWSDTVRSALMWLGKADPVQSMEAARAEDPVLGEIADMLEAWKEAIGIGADKRLKTTDVIVLGESMVRTKDGGELEPTHLALNGALVAIARRNKANRPDAKMLGLWLRDYKGRVVDGLRFQSALRRRVNEWWIEAI